MKVVGFDAAQVALLAGSVGVLPTDTLYGVVARVADEAAVTRLYHLKHREHNPGTIVAADMQQLLDMGIAGDALQKAVGWWPNPVSIILPAGEQLTYLHQGLDSLAVRVPSDPVFRRFLQATGPLLTSSANLPGQPEAHTIMEAQQYFGENIDFYVDGGDLSTRLPSTLIRATGPRLELLRDGALPVDESQLHA